jgi:hypothetical protein
MQEQAGKLTGDKEKEKARARKAGNPKTPKRSWGS